MSGAIPPLPQYSFMAWCLVKHRDNFTFTSGVNPEGRTLDKILYAAVYSDISDCYNTGS